MLTHELQIGQIVRSKAGRDGGKFYVVVAWTRRDVFVADGRKHTKEQPKRKNKKHLWYTRTVSDAQSNETIWRVLADFVDERA